MRPTDYAAPMTWAQLDSDIAAKHTHPGCSPKPSEQLAAQAEQIERLRRREEELMARLRALDTGVIDEVEADAARECAGWNRNLNLSEVALISALNRVYPRTLSGAQIMECLPSRDHTVDRHASAATVRVFSVRQKFGKGAIENQRGLGYRLGRGLMAYVRHGDTSGLEGESWVYAAEPPPEDAPMRRARPAQELLPPWARGLTRQHMETILILHRAYPRIVSNVMLIENLPVASNRGADRCLKLANVLIREIRQRKGHEAVETIYRAGYRLGEAFNAEVARDLMSRNLTHSGENVLTDVAARD